MKTLKNKILAITISIFFILSMSATLMLMPNASAHSPPWQIPTFAYVTATPNPIGVGQTVTISMWLTNLINGELVSNNILFHNFMLTITAPNGDITTETFPEASLDSFVSYYFTPNQVGTYTLNFTFPGQAYTQYAYSSVSPFVNDTYLRSTATGAFTVQQQPIPGPLSYPLPTSYWTRPISGQDTSWFAVASNYLSPNVAAYSFGAIRYVPGTTAPTSGHIMWTDPIQFGGYTGVNSPDNGTSFYDGRSYQDRFNTPIIIAGNLYFGLPVSDAGAIGTSGGTTSTGTTTITNLSGVAVPTPVSEVNPGFVDINLQTGQQVWKQYYNINPSFGAIVNVVNPNQAGALAYLIAVSGTTWIVYDAYTGDWIFNITDVPIAANNAAPINTASPTVSINSPQTYGNYGPDGEPEIYILNTTPTGTGDWLALWNWTDVIGNGNTEFEFGSGYRPVGRVIDTNTQASYSWNATLSALPSGSNIEWAIDGDLLLGANIPSDQFGGVPNLLTTQLSTTAVYEPQTATFFALSLNPSTLGQLLWEKTYTTPDNETFQLGQVDPANGVFIMDSKETLQWYGYSLTDGSQLWGPVGNATAFNYYSTIGQGSSADVGYIANGDFYVGGYGGLIYCYSDTTGALQWTWGNGPIGSTNSTNSGVNTPYGNYPNFIGLIADGMVYVYNGNHGNGVPFYKGETITCLNATTGAQIWSEQSGVEVGGFEDWRIPVADGDIAYFNYYDGQVYCVGQGPSATTIETPLDGITQGGSLVIQGTVMDTAAGTKQEEQAADFPNGVPCVSDASESAWMQYVYMGLPMPTNVTGVPVTISAIDPNGNNVILGTTTTDFSGSYSIEINTNNLSAGPGLYKVTATFAGSNSYWPSSAESNLVVQPSAQTPAPTAPPVTSLASTATVELGIAAVIIVIVIIGAVLAVLMLRKRP